MMHDVLVIGAGLSGLAVARGLSRRGASVRVLEARERVGGRTWSRTLGAGRFDVGGQWIGPGQHRMHSLVQELGVATFEQHVDGEKILLLGQKRTTYASDIPSLGIVDLATMRVLLGALDLARRRVADPRAPTRRRFGRRTHEIPLSAIADRMNARVRGVFDAALRTIFGAEAEDLSTADFLAYLDAGEGLLSLAEARGGAQQTRFQLGAQTLSERLATYLDVVLGAPVSKVTKRAATFEVTHGAGTDRAGRVVFALPPNLLAGLDLPGLLSPERQAYAAGFAMGRTTKVLLTYRQAWWRDAGLSGELVSDGLVSIAMDATSHDLRQPALVAFVVGAQADRLAALPESQRDAAIVDALVPALGPEVATATSITRLAWVDEPYSGGCPVACLPAGAPTHPSVSDVDGLHFAGTESAREYRGYMEGALEAAERVVAELAPLTTEAGAAGRRSPAP